MKYVSLMVCLILLCCLPLTAQAATPMHLGGFSLGGDIHDYPDRLDIESCRPIHFQEYLGEGAMKPSPGFKSGRITYGRCDQVNKIVRIKLKFLNSSKDFFEVILEKYKTALGSPDEYKGDPFQTFIAWKWSFKDTSGRRVTLILQHNLGDSDEKIGNAVKMTLVDQLEKERDCDEAKRVADKGSPIPELEGKAMWEMYVPH